MNSMFHAFLGLGKRPRIIPPVDGGHTVIYLNGSTLIPGRGSALGVVDVVPAASSRGQGQGRNNHAFVYADEPNSVYVYYIVGGAL